MIKTVITTVRYSDGTSESVTAELLTDGLAVRRCTLRPEHWVVTDTVTGQRVATAKARGAAIRSANRRLRRLAARLHADRADVLAAARALVQQETALLEGLLEGRP